ncbi:MAG TPA: DoxX family protein [Gemmataceae bacterium]|nr:DoxX family protein [Gemmataceae bacterium]
MNTWTRVGLVVLRVVIGWHFLFEGVSKLESWYHGPREGKPVWSSAGYLSESQGPLAPWFRQQVGDPDGNALAKLTLPKEADKLPAVVETEWTAQFNGFVEHYGLGKDKAVQPEYVGVVGVMAIGPFPTTLPWAVIVRGSKDDQMQLTLAKEDLEIARQRALAWFTGGTREVPSKIASVSEKVKETTPERIALYKKKLQQLADIEEKGMPAFDHDVWKDNYRALKKEIATLRTELLRDLDKPFNDTMAVAKFRLSKAQLDKGSVPQAATVTNLDRINIITAWGTTIVGACLLLGLFTRLSCVAGACFLLLFYLAMPALPWLPDNVKSEGHYVFINKNIIEMIALLALATTSSGKWLGLDSLLQFVNPFRKRQAAA